MPIHTIALTFIAVFSFFCILAVLFFERKNPASSLVWVLVLLFLPVAGFIFYLFLGSGFRITRQKKYKLKAISDGIYKNYIAKHLNLDSSQRFIVQHTDTARLVNYLDNQPDGAFTDNNNAEIFTQGDAMFSRLLEDMKAAKKHIHVLFYIFRNDATGRAILSVLEEKARAGVEVRLLYDSVGTLMAFDTPFRKLKKAGGKVRAFAPIFSSINSHLRLNYRNHRKIVVVDGQIAYLGGMNVGDEYRGLHKRLTPWRDTHLRITGSAVWFLQERFIMDWAYSSDTDPSNIDVGDFFPEPLVEGNMGMQIVSSGPDTYESPIKSGMLAMIYAAKKCVYIQTPYFSPYESFTDALRIASRSDVDVKLMIPKICDYEFVHWATMGYVREMLDAGIDVHMYKGFIHAKTMVVDGSIATIGTTNLTNRSFTLDFEVNAFIYDTAFAERCAAIFEADLENCEQVPKDYFMKKSRAARAGYNFARMFAPMM